MPVSIPLDKICVRNGIFCPKCQSLLDQGKYSDLDVAVMRALLDLERKYRGFDIRFIKSYQIDDLLYVLVEARPGVPASLGRDIRERLPQEMGISRVMVVEYKRDPRTMLEQLFHPYPVLSLEEAYLPDGSNVAVIRLPSEARGFVESFKGRILLRLAQKLLGKPVHIEYQEARVERLDAEMLGLKKHDPRKLFEGL